MLSGVAATKRIGTLVPGTSVLVLSMLSDETAVSSALGAGAAGYLVKDCTTSEIVDAVTRAHGGTVAVDESPHGGARFTVRLPPIPTGGREPAPAQWDPWGEAAARDASRRDTR